MGKASLNKVKASAKNEVKTISQSISNFEPAPICIYDGLPCSHVLNGCPSCASDDGSPLESVCERFPDRFRSTF